MDNIECPFCKIQLSNHPDADKLKIVYESDTVMAFHSTKPFAEVHIVVISKKHIPTVFDLTDGDNDLKLEMLKAVDIASREIIEQKGACKVEMYLGSLQWTKHIHCHVIYDPSID